ncbi:MAG TPA: hypothetical protein VLL54_18590 [Pyrinomonadaceae bacterium]|nr:hypothetical protein [Pyrinomonadaceae bacterium]
MSQKITISHRSLLIAAVLSIFLLSVPARSQESTASASKDDGTAAELRKKGVDLLQSVAGQIQSLSSGENRARMSSISGALLWKYDEKRARELFTAARDEIMTGLADNNDRDDATTFRAFLVFKQVRSDTLTRIADHDPELALEFLRATRLPPDSEPEYYGLSTERALELRLASQIAERNPKLAVRLGRQSLAKGLSYEVMSLFEQLRKQDKEATATLFKALVEKLKSSDFENDQYAGQVATYLVKSFQPPEADAVIYRELISALLASASSKNCATVSEDEASSFCYLMASLIPEIEKYDARQAHTFKRWVSEEGESNSEILELSGPDSFSEQANEIIRNGTVDEILALGSSNQSPGREFQIRRAAITKAQANGDVARARKIAAEYSDERMREFLLQQIERDEMVRAVDAEKLAAIQEKARQLPKPENRFAFLLEASLQIGPKDPKSMLTLLNQANQIADSMKPGKPQVEAKLGLAMLYCLAKSDRGFAIMESVLPRLNELVAAAASLDGFENNYLHEGEWNMSGGGGVGELLNELARSAGSFAVMDFDRAVELSNQFERPELRLMAKLKLAEAALSTAQR